MLRVCALLVVVGCAFADIETWPFTLADKYMEEFKASNDELRKSAHNNQFQYHLEENFDALKFNESLAEKHAMHFDFIIVGGGTSGAVLANRLSETPEWRVLLLEAGGYEDCSTKIPKNWELLQNTHLNWAFKTTPQNYSCRAQEDCKCVIPGGKVLGGSSSIDSMVYTRGNPRDYDLWADHGNKGWCWDDVKPIFKKIEDADFEPFDKHYHHRGGYQHLQHPQHTTFLQDIAVEAGKESGLDFVDYNGKYQYGVSIPQLTTYCGRRFSTASAYLEPTKKRKNLVVKPYSQVIKLIISQHTKEAQGVYYIHEGELYSAKAEKEVILTAGPINTPKLLILSGIGPNDECKKLKIDPLVDLNVGHHLTLRPSFIGLDLIYEDAEHHHDHEHRIDEYHDIIFYMKNGEGHYTSNGIEALAYYKSEASKEQTKYPDIELKFISKYYTDYEKARWSLSKDSYDSIWKPLEGKKGVKIVITLNHPKSKGFLKLYNNHPLNYPIIEPELLGDEDEYDFHRLLSGIKDVLKLIETKPFLKHGLKLNIHQIHGCEDHKIDSIEYWKCAIKHLTVATGDVTGTARMGPEDDKYAVVDNYLRVRGVSKLRIADASVIPVPITGSLLAPTIMIGEKAADLICEDWQKH